MRRSVTFFLFLCFLLLGGIPSACAGAAHFKAFRLPAHSPDKAGMIKQKGDQTSSLLTGYRDLPADSDLPLLAEDDDDQEEIIKKARPLAESFLTPFACISGAPPSHLTNYLFFHHRAYTSYCKYILHSALRI